MTVVLVLVLLSWILQRLARAVVKDDDLKGLVRAIAVRVQNGSGKPTE